MRIRRYLHLPPTLFSGMLAAAMLCIISPLAFCQTKMIAHRSHSGSLESFGAGGEGNFGISPEQERRMMKRGFPIGEMDSVFRLSDTSAIEFSTIGVDTVVRDHYWNNPNIKVDSLRKLFPDINFIGYDDPKHNAEIIRDSRTATDAAFIETSERAPDSGDGITMLTLLGSIALPLLAYGIWRTEKVRRT